MTERLQLSDKVKAGIYVSSVAMFPDDLSSRDVILNPVREANIEAGLMLVVLKPDHVLNSTNVQKQLDNLDPFVKKSDGERPAVFVMHSWKPLTGTADPCLNFLSHRSFSVDYANSLKRIRAHRPWQQHCTVSKSRNPGWPGPMKGSTGDREQS